MRLGRKSAVTARPVAGFVIRNIAENESTCLSKGRGLRQGEARAAVPSELAASSPAKPWGRGSACYRTSRQRRPPRPLSCVPFRWKWDALRSSPRRRAPTVPRASHRLVPEHRLKSRVRVRFPVRSAPVEPGYARVSTAKQDLDRQIEALLAAGVVRERIHVDKKSGATVDRPGLRAVLQYAREGDVIVVHTLDRLGRTLRDTLNMIYELSERGIGVRNLADPIKVDSSQPQDPMAQPAVVLLALFAQMERTYTIERAAHARGEGSAGRAPGARGRREAAVGGRSARPGRHDRADRRQDRDPAHQSVSPPAAAAGAGCTSRRCWCCSARRRVASVCGTAPA